MAVTFLFHCQLQSVRPLRVLHIVRLDQEAGSISSPIARALIGKNKGDSVEVTTPKGSRSFQVLKVEWK